MSTKSIIASCKYQLYRLRLIPLFFAVWAFGTMLVTAISRTVFIKVPFSFSGTNSGGYDLFMGTVLFGFMCAYITDFFNTAAANGVSRMTACISAYITSVIFSIISAVEVSIISPIIALISGTEFQDEMSLWGAGLYGNVYALSESGWGDIAIRARFFGVCIFGYIAVCAFVILFASLIYRLPSWLSLLILFLMIFMPTGGIYLAFGVEVLAKFVNGVLTFVGLENIAYFDVLTPGDASRGAVVFIAGSLVMLLLSCLITRHSAVKPLAIRNN